MVEILLSVVPFGDVKHTDDTILYVDRPEHTFCCDSCEFYETERVIGVLILVLKLPSS